MATVTKPIALDESIHTTEQTPRNIADVLAEELARIAENILPPNAEDIAYDNTASGLTATNVQDAIDEVISSQSEVIADTMADLTENKTATVTDGVADFETIDGSLVKSLVVEIEPSQSGSGTPSPSNIRPITGWAQEDVTVVGKNRLDPTSAFGSFSGYTVNTDGSVTVTEADGRTWDNIAPIPLKAGTYTLSRDVTVGRTAIRTSDNNYGSDIIIFEGRTSISFTLAQDGGIKAKANYGSTYPITINLQLEKGNTATTFEPYHGKTYTTAFGQTVYGGTLDVLTGELTIDRGYAELTANLEISRFYVGASLVQFFTRSIVNDGKINGGIISNIFVEGVNVPYGCSMTLGGGETTGLLMYIPVDTAQTVDEFKSWLTSNPTHICYELATSTTIQLTPQTVKALVGENHISASTGDVLECKYSKLINGDDLEMLLS